MIEAVIKMVPQRPLLARGRTVLLRAGSLSYQFDSLTMLICYWPAPTEDVLPEPITRPEYNIDIATVH